MKKGYAQSLQICALIMGTIVGAGFSTGQEIIQFFSRYGLLALYAIFIATLLFIWLGYKIMKLSASLDAKSFEDLNIALFGKKIGTLMSWFLFVVLIGVCSVMLAGAGAVFKENWHISAQFGLVFTVITTFFVVRRGLNAIFLVNSIVVPVMILFTFILFFDAFASPQFHFHLEVNHTKESFMRGIVTPFIYVALNLTLAQAVLVPIGSKIKDTKILKRGAILAGLGVGLMILIIHLTLVTHYGEISHLAIPMGGIAASIGGFIYIIYIIIIYAEIFTTLVANIYGLTLQSKQYTKLPSTFLYGFTLFVCYLFAQLGFEVLITYLYQIFGFISLGWLALLMYYRKQQ